MTQPNPASSSDEFAEADDWDQHWSDYADSAEQNPAQTWRRRLVVNELGLTARARVLDIGSGQGDLAADLLTAEPDLAVRGLELSTSGVEHAQAKIPTAEFRRVDLIADDPVFDDLVGWADAAVCSEVLEHVDEPAVLLGNALRYVAPGARVVVTVPAGPRTAFDKHIGHRRHYDRSSIAAVMTEAGLEVESVEAAGFPFFNLYRLVVFARGKKLIEDVAASPDDAVTTKGAGVVLRIFDRLFRYNRRGGRFGWQLIAVGQVPASSR